MNNVKSIILIFYLFCLCSCCKSSKNSMPEQLSLNFQSDYKAFFYAFPSDFNQFVHVYGYIDIGKDSVWYAPLYKDGYDQVSYLFSHAEDVPEKNFINKIIKLSQNSFWQADACNFLHHYSYEYVCKHIDSVVRELKKCSNEEQYQFWYFLFNGPHSDKKDYAKLFELIKVNNDPMDFGIIDSAWNIVEQEWIDE